MNEDLTTKQKVALEILKSLLSGRSNYVAYNEYLEKSISLADKFLEKTKCKITKTGES
jgi:hypothetical protein